jgi:hypothetical protein
MATLLPVTTVKEVEWNSRAALVVMEMRKCLSLLGIEPQSTNSFTDLTMPNLVSQRKNRHTAKRQLTRFK